MDLKIQWMENMIKMKLLLLMKKRKLNLQEELKLNKCLTNYIKNLQMKNIMLLIVI